MRKPHNGKRSPAESLEIFFKRASAIEYVNPLLKKLSFWIACEFFFILFELIGGYVPFVDMRGQGAFTSIACIFLLTHIIHLRYEFTCGMKDKKLHASVKDRYLGYWSNTYEYWNQIFDDSLDLTEVHVFNSTRQARIVCEKDLINRAIEYYTAISKNEIEYSKKIKERDIHMVYHSPFEKELLIISVLKEISNRITILENE